MALKRLVIDGYGQLELNNCAFRRDGRIEAQCAPDGVTFANTPIENGMILGIDNVKHVVKYADGKLPVGLVYTSEHIYDERTPGLKNFKTNGKDDFYPRLGYLAYGDKFTTNCLCYDDTEYSGGEEELITALGKLDTPVYGCETNTGAIKLTATDPTDTAQVAMRVIKYYTMPDGQKAVKLQVIA